MMVCKFKNASAFMLAATVMPSRSVMRFASTFCAVSEREFKTPHSRTRLPNISKPIKATERGDTIPAIMVTTMGNIIFVSFDMGTVLYGIRISRSFFVVSKRITGGCTIGTSDI